MKKKIIILLAIVLIALITLAIFLMLPEGKDNKAALAFKEEYESLNGKENKMGKVHRTVTISEDNPYVKVTPKEIVDMIKNKKTFYLYVGDPLCPWCRSVIEQSIKSAKDNSIEKIYYIDIWDEEGNEILRDKYELVDGEVKESSKGTKEYYQLLKYLNPVLEDYTLTDSDGNKVEVGEKRIYAPNYFFIKDGVVKFMTSGNSDKQKDSREELTKEILKDEEEMFDELFLEVCDDAC